ncbi:peroxisome proliferator-activated receptor gamma coactivator-related protein 1 [Genypterus blacodes]|uniref:peroxisome proliferator-activated receptor gamma coactivator-related protein 1 n=1 Tax=Genypterus blacodes TaxID=154954 RepID=UPI003F762262
MAARWGVGEEILTECNLDFFRIDTLDEADALNSGGTLEALQSYLDPSILSIFEDTPTIEAKGVYDESEATLLTALTEILDNVDDENLSPFDTLPDSDLLAGQKGREQSPLRRLQCLSLSLPEKDSACLTRSLTAGKSLPRIDTHSLQRSDGEEEDGLLTLASGRQHSSLDNELIDWRGLALPPFTLEQEGEDGLSVCLGDLVRHMHPYCMAICVENDEGEQILPEGGILLEIVDQGENGEPILAIPGMEPPVSLPVQEHCSENTQVPDEIKNVTSDSSDSIVVEVSEAPVKVADPVKLALCCDVNEMAIKKPKEEMKDMTPSRRKKKKRCNEVCQVEPVEGRVLRSSYTRKNVEEMSRKPPKIHKTKKTIVPMVPDASAATFSTSINRKINSVHAEKHAENITTTTLSLEVSVKEAASVSSKQDMFIRNAERHEPGCTPTTVNSKRLNEMHKQSVTVLDKLEFLPAANSGISPVAQPATEATDSRAAAPVPVSLIHPPCEVLSPVAPTVPEPKPKSLSLKEYWRLRQQKKLAPSEKQEDHSTKWPSLPELPKELPPIPCLPDPSPKDPRRTHLPTAKKEEDEVKTAWQPRGPCAPPTPEALLVPPTYMVASSTKVSSATRIPKIKEACAPQMISTPKSESKRLNPAAAPLEVLPTDTHIASIPFASQNSGSLSSQPATQVMPIEDSKPTNALLGKQCAVVHGTRLQPVELSTVCPKTTVDEIQRTTPNASAQRVSNAPAKTTTIAQKMTKAIAPSPVIYPGISSSGKSSKLTPLDTQSCSSPHLKEDPVMLGAKGTSTTSKSKELSKSSTNEMGIEAADLTSLLEQFEETQAIEEQHVPEGSCRAATVENSSVEFVPEKTIMVHVKANDLSNTAALTPPATPPHQIWKPLAPVALVGKRRPTEASKAKSSMVIQIEAQHLHSARLQSKPTFAAATAILDPSCMDHDYCLPNKPTAGEPGKRWNVKQQSSISIKPIKQPTQSPPVVSALSVKTTTNYVDMNTQEFTQSKAEVSSVLETPDASPTRNETDITVKERSPKQEDFGRSYRRQATSHTPNPRSSPKERGRGRRRQRESRHSPSNTSSSSESESDSHSSRSRSPSKKRYCPSRSGSSTSQSSYSSSRSSTSVSRSPPRKRRYSYSSCSSSWSHSRSRSRSPQRPVHLTKRRRLCSPTYRSGYCAKRNAEDERRREKAIEERRVVYVGRIRGSMTQTELKDRFTLFGEIEDCTLHFRDHGDNYGFVTYYNIKDAFTAIENGSKLRKPDELPFDLCFGGRRQFCQTSYADLDSNRGYEPSPAKGKFHGLDFDTLLKQAQQNQKR